MKKIAYMVILMSFILFCCRLFSNAAVPFQDDFESGTLSSWSISPGITASVLSGIGNPGSAVEITSNSPGNYNDLKANSVLTNYSTYEADIYLEGNVVATISFASDGTAGNSYQIFIEGVFQTQIRRISSGTVQANTIGAPLSLNTWHHLKIDRNTDNSIKLFVDGGLTPYLTLIDSNITNDGFFFIGCYRQFGTGCRFDNITIGGVDTTPPITTAALSGAQCANGYYNSDVTVTLTATDDASGVKKTEYSLDGVNFQTYTAPFTITANGTTTVYFKSTDNAGNVEAVKSTQLGVDKTPPIVTSPKPTIADGYYPNNKDVPISATITDAGGNGLDVSSLKLYYSTSPSSIGNPLPFNFDAVTGKLTASLSCVTSSYNLMTVFAKDNCGNTIVMDNPARSYYQWSWSPSSGPARLRTISPDNAENVGTVHLTLGGYDFDFCGATVSLKYPGKPDIPCTNVVVSDNGQTATCDADINGAQTGLWKIYMYNPVFAGTGTAFVYLNVWDRSPTDVGITKGLSFRSWKTFTYDITVYNTGPGVATNVSVKDTLPSVLSPVAIIPPGVYDASTNTVTWDAGLIPPLQNKVFTVQAPLPSAATMATMGDIYCLTDIAKVQENNPLQDTNPANDTFQHDFCVAPVWWTHPPPFDPNDKVVSPEGFITTNQILMYDIHFENIGAGPAINVKVTDTLDANLDADTLYPISSGGFFDPDTRTITWDLQNRNLQPGESDAVSYVIKPKAGLTDGTEIKNKATVYFDHESPIDTEEVISTIGFPRPFAQILSPESGTFSNVPQLKIYGAATSFAYSKFASYTLSYGAGQNPGSFTAFFTGSTEVAGALLGTLNTSGLSGLYTLKLTVTDTEGHAAEDKTTVYLNTPPQITIIGTKGKQNGQFQKPVDVAIDKDKFIYVLDNKEDKQNNAVQKFNAQGNLVLAFGNKDTLKNPVAVEANDTTIYVLDRDAKDGKIKVFSQSGTLLSSCGNDLGKPVDMALRDKILAVLDVLSENQGVVRIYDASPCAAKKQFTLTGTQNLERAKGITLDGFGNVYVAYKGEDASKDFIQIYSPAGTLVKTYGSSPFFTENPHVEGIVSDDNFITYVVNEKAQNSAVLGYDGFRNLIYKFGIKGKSTGEFLNPQGISVSSDGKLIAVADTENNRVQLLSLSGTSVPSLAKQAPQTQEEGDDSILTKTILYQNPVRSSQLRFGFPLTNKGKQKAKEGALQISVEVFTLTGKKIADIVCNASDEQCNWQQELPNGVYIYRLKAKTLDGTEESKVGKIVVVR